MTDYNNWRFTFAAKFSGESDTGHVRAFVRGVVVTLSLLDVCGHTLGVLETLAGTLLKHKIQCL